MQPKNQTLEDQPDMHDNYQPLELLKHPKSKIHDEKLNVFSKVDQERKSIPRNGVQFLYI